MDRGSENDNERLPRIGVRLLAITQALVLSSCGGFSKAWDHAPDQANDGISGRWEGRWWSEMNGHSGSLRCVANPSADSEDCDLRFHATWGRWFRGNFQITCHLEPAEAGWKLQGERDLGPLIGVYSFEGEVAGDSLTASYCGGQDYGKFEMLRPTSP